MADESALVDRVRAGDERAFQEMVDQHKSMVLRLAFRMTRSWQDAEDLSQETFVRAFQSFDRFREDSKLSSWLYRIAFNLCLDTITRPGWKRDVDIAMADRESAPDAEERAGTGPGQMAALSIMEGQVHKALGLLSPRERSVFVLRHYEEKSIKEIAELLSLRIGTVKTLLFRAVKKLQIQLSHFRKDIRE